MPVKHAVAKTWSIAPSSDGKRWSAWPAGDKNSLVFPTGMTDPVFTGMTERGAAETLNTVAGTTYVKQSWNPYSGDQWSVLMNNNVTMNYCRMKTREGPRYRGYTGTAFNWCYIETYGIAGDHSDGMQWEGGANALTAKNCHFRGLDGGFTCFFAADGSTGSFVFEDCLFTTDGGSTHHALVLYADAGVGTITLSLKNCYFQTAADWDFGSPFDIAKTVGTNPVDVVLWDNVRYCTWDHTNKILVPGSLITQPAGT